MITNMKTIAVCVQNLTSGGAEKQSVLLAKAIVERYKVIYIVFNGENVHQKYIEMLSEDERIEIVMFKGCLVSRFIQLCQCLKQKKIFALFSYLTAAGLYTSIAGRLIGISKIYPGIRNVTLPPMKTRINKFFTNYLATKTIINCYSGEQNFLNKGFRPNKLTVIPNCFENVLPYWTKESRSNLHIITVGRFVAQKDYETAIHSIAELKRKGHSEFVFDIVGYGVLESQIRKWVEVYDIEDCTNIYINPDNIPELLSKADIYLSTSLIEGTSNSIMEGMNANLPIVATNVGDNDHLVRQNENGLLCEAGDWGALSKALEILINDEKLRISMGKKSKELLLTNYSVEIFREKYFKLLDDE